MPRICWRRRGAVEHMNADHRDAMGLYATKLLGAAEGDWRCTGCDPEGLDMQEGTDALRLDFPERVTDRHGAAQDAGPPCWRSAREEWTSAQQFERCPPSLRPKTAMVRSRAARGFMTRRYLTLVAGLALTIAASLATPELCPERSRRGEPADQRLRSAGKYSEALPLAQAMVAMPRRLPTIAISPARSTMSRRSTPPGSRRPGRAALQARHRTDREGRPASTASMSRRC